VTAAVFILRRKMPDAERPYRAWGYPIVPVLFLLATALILGTTLLGVREDFVNALAMIAHGQVLSGVGMLARNPPIAGVALIALGLPVYWIWSRMYPAQTAE
jgi:APA family basic amino acid/polyamine antiporter